MADKDKNDDRDKKPKRPEERGPLGKLVDAIVAGMGELFAPQPVPVPIPVRPDRRRRR